MSPIRRICHWGPLASVAIIASITLATITTKTSFLWIFVFQMTMCLTLYNMWCATLIGPGYISVTSPVESPTNGRFCKRCCHIVLRKHHHCPWINNCVGQNNEQYFLRFLMFAIAVTIQSSLILIIDAYRRYTLNMMVIFDIFNIGLSVGVLIAISVLLYTH